MENNGVVASVSDVVAVGESWSAADGWLACQDWLAAEDRLAATAVDEENRLFDTEGASVTSEAHTEDPAGTAIDELTPGSIPTTGRGASINDTVDVGMTVKAQGATSVTLAAIRVVIKLTLNVLLEQMRMSVTAVEAQTEPVYTAVTLQGMSERLVVMAGAGAAVAAVVSVTIGHDADSNDSMAESDTCRA